MAVAYPKYQPVAPLEMVVVTSAVTAGMFVKMNAATGVEPAGNGDEVLGIALNDAAVGEICQVQYMGTIDAKAATGVNFALGNDVYLEASHEVGTGATTEKSMGKVVRVDPASGGRVEVALQSSFFFTRTTHA